MHFFTSRLHKVSIVLFALANILQYSFLQAINFEYVNAIFFIYSVVCNWFLEDNIVYLKGMENRIKAELKAEISKMEIIFTAELKKKANKIGNYTTYAEIRASLQTI
jgi:hypothetical protein